MKSRILFVCTGNSARSQMAEGLLRHMAGHLFAVYSAGTEPRGLHPLAVEAMASHGLDISQQHSSPLTDFQDQSFDYVITLCDRAREVCPDMEGLYDTLHWTVDDPAVDNKPLDFQAAIKEIKTRLGFLVIIEEKRRKPASGASSER